MSLCGPTNALNKLSQHSQVDRSLQQDYQRRFAPSGVESFKSTQQNHQLDLEFQQQQQQQQFQQNFNPIFANAFGKPLQRAHPQQQQPSQSSWASDFAAHNQQQQLHHQAPQYTHGWNEQFKTFQNQPQAQIPAPSIATPRSFTNLAQLSNLSMTQASLGSTSTAPHFRTEHEELHHGRMDILDHELESEFAKLEQEFQNTTIKEEPPVVKRANSDFANAAMQVVDAMNTTNSDKFKQSKFLSLMNMVAQGKVELSEDETKLVDEAGQDIHPTDQDGKLPDPLEGIPDNSLETPFQAAQMVGDNHHEIYTWDDVYDDYRHDDSSF